MDLTHLDAALEAAHLPALMAAVVHLTGSDDAIRPEWRPTYTPLVRDDIGLSAETMAEMRAYARAAIEAYAAGRPLAPTPSASTLRKQMEFVAGTPIPEHYADFLMDELAIAGESSKDPQWTAPNLRAKAGALHVLVIGAGMSGLLAGIRLKQAGVPFTIVEKNPEVGGTWFENTYPGCRVDSSNHMYSYSFEPNHGWPQHFSTQPVLLDYFRGVAERYDLKRHIRFNTAVERMVFDEAANAWRVEVSGAAGLRETISADAVITAVGQLNRPNIPDIEGRDSFAGPAFHSAQWDHDVDLTGKRVAVIGTGASAYQFVPEIASAVAHMDVYQRTPPWAFPAPHYHHDVEASFRWLLEEVPFYDKWYRFFLFWSATDGMIAAVTADEGWNGPASAVGAANAEFRELLTQAFAAQLADAPELMDKVVPAYPVGGKRGLLDNGVWLAALKRSNVDLVTDRIARITPTGVVTEDGTERPADVLIYGTGFKPSRFLWPMEIVGRGGRTLEQHWAGEPRAYLGMTTPGFPNLFMLYGPNTNIVVNGSIIFFSECSVRYVLECLKLLAEQGKHTLEPKIDVTEAFNRQVDAANSRMAWGSPNVNSWYKSASGRVSQNWPFPLVDYWRATLRPNPADFEIR